MTCTVKQLDERNEILKLHHGDEAAFAQIYKRYHQKIYANILKIVHAPEHAEEILQDVFLSLWQKRYQLDSDKPLANWLFVVSFNKSMDFLRKKVRDYIDYVEDSETRYADVADDLEQDDVLQEKLRIIDEAVASLSPRKKEVFRLYRYQGYSKEQVAQTMDLSIQSVSEYLKQANKSIKRYIQENHAYEYGNGVFLVLLPYLFP